MPYINILDYLLLPFFFIGIYLIAVRIRNIFYPPKHPWRKYFLLALGVKLFGAVLNGTLHYYYYGGGDTFNFFHDAIIINNSLKDSTSAWIKLLFQLSDYYDISIYKYTSQMYFYNDPSSYIISSISSVISLITFNTYLPTAVLFACISFTGTWALFRTFAKLYPHLTRQIAVATLFIPTTIMWGSAVYKDTICMFGLGWLTYGIFRFLIQKDFSVKNILLALVSFFLIAKIKIYILIAFMPALGLWILYNYAQAIKVEAVKKLMRIVVPILVVSVSILLMSIYSKELGAYSLDNIASSAESIRSWVYYVSVQDQGSGYDLGKFDPSIQGMLTKFPQAVNVSLFRPYLWEAKKVIMLFSALESFVFLLLTLRVLFTIGLKRFWDAIGKMPTAQFCLIFSIIFAFAVGVTTYNFGTLSRYKIPCLPFYTLAMILIFYRYQPTDKKILPPIF